VSGVEHNQDVTVDDELIALLRSVASGDEPGDVVERLGLLLPTAASRSWTSELTYITRHYSPNEPETHEALVQLARRATARYPCPCCGYLTSSGPGSYDICPICGWEDDLSQLRFPKMAGGANHVSLVEAQANFAATGASEERGIAHVRPGRPDDTRDPSWRPIDLTRDNVELPARGVEYGHTYPHDSTQLYYWLPTYWRRH
jgi:hypothetical protein